MDIVTARRATDATGKSVFSRRSGGPVNGKDPARKCNKNVWKSPYYRSLKNSRIVTPENPPRRNLNYSTAPENSFVATPEGQKRKGPRYGPKNLSGIPSKNLMTLQADCGPRKRSLVWTRGDSGSDDRSNQQIFVGSGYRSAPNNVCNMKGRSTQKDKNKVCKFWASGNCTKNDECRFLHSWHYGDGFSMLAKLEGHEKAVTGITLPSGSDRLYTGSVDGTARVWNCHTGQCVQVVNYGDKVGSLISEGPWVFVGLRNFVKALNIQTSAEFNLEGPVGQVNAMAVANDMLFAGAQDGVISAWKGGSESNPFQLVASMEGHTSSVICLTVGYQSKILYSGSMDHSIRVWDLDILQCIGTLNEHTDVVMSLLCWNEYLLSCSLDRTIKVWGTTEEGKLGVTFTFDEEHGVLALSGIEDEDAKPILCCACNDNSVRLYELPSFTERGRLFGKQEVREIVTGPDGLFFTGDGSGMLTVWKWLAKPSEGGHNLC